MKRSQIKRTQKPLRRTKLRKVSPATIPRIKREIWALQREITFFVHGRNCYTCPAKNLVGKNLQCGHVPWPESVLPSLLKRDYRLTRAQCMRCNIHGSGMGAEAYRKMRDEIGEDAMEELERERHKTIRAGIIEWRARLEEYKLLMASLG